MIGGGVSGLPTRSQIENWETGHLRSAAQSWRAAAAVWINSYDEIAEGLPTPNGSVWEGDASDAAQARTNRDRSVAQLLAERLRSVAEFAERGSTAIDAAKQEALVLIQLVEALGFDAQEDLSLVDRIPGANARQRQQQATLLAAALRTVAAQLISTDHTVATGLNEGTAVFETVSNGSDQQPSIQTVSNDSDQDFGACFTENFKDDVGKNMVEGVFRGGLLGAGVGAVGGAFGGPVGALGGAVIGFVMGSLRGALITGPGKTAVESAVDCL